MIITPNDPPIRVAIIDLYDNIPNEGMRALKELLTQHDGAFGPRIEYNVLETRYKDEIPTLDYDIYLSSGGPGSPFDGEGTAWENGYFDWLDAVWNHNERTDDSKKHVLFICHSFQMMVRFFELAEVAERQSASFGIFPVHKTEAGEEDPLLKPLADPFFAADFRKFQVIQPDEVRMKALGAEITCIEKERPHVELERAVMGIRLSPELVGVQFHPEADPPGMSVHFRKPERRDVIVEEHGEEKYERILHRLEEPDYLRRTHDTVVPFFLRHAIDDLRPPGEQAKPQPLRRVA